MWRKKGESTFGWLFCYQNEINGIEFELSFGKDNDGSTKFVFFANRIADKWEFMVCWKDIEYWEMYSIDRENIDIKEPRAHSFLFNDLFNDDFNGIPSDDVEKIESVLLELSYNLI